MRVRLTLALSDRPGVLLRALEQIAVNGGNIISIIHSRDRITSGYVPVSINVEFPDSASLERAKRGIEASGIPVMEAETLEKAICTILLIGAIRIEELVERVHQLGSRVAEVSMTGGLTSPCIKAVIEAPSEKVGTLLKSLEEFAEEREALLITEG